TVADFVKGIPNFHATGFNDHRGIGAARNFGIDHATGQAVAFVENLSSIF
ncbi:glycosyltransferase family 2 protein, partial [Lactobacillus sp. DS22_6]